jgi:hypothetical protein
VFLTTDMNSALSLSTHIIQKELHAIDEFGDNATLDISLSRIKTMKDMLEEIEEKVENNIPDDPDPEYYSNYQDLRFIKYMDSDIFEESEKEAEGEGDPEVNGGED